MLVLAKVQQIHFPPLHPAAVERPAGLAGWQAEAARAGMFGNRVDAIVLVRRTASFSSVSVVEIHLLIVN